MGTNYYVQVRAHRYHIGKSSNGNFLFHFKSVLIAMRQSRLEYVCSPVEALRALATQGCIQMTDDEFKTDMLTLLDAYPPVNELGELLFIPLRVWVERITAPAPPDAYVGALRIGALYGSELDFI